MDESIQPALPRRRSNILPQRPLPIPNAEGSSNEPKISEGKNFDLKLPSTSKGDTIDVNYLNSCVNNLTSEKLAWKNFWAERKLLKNSENRTKAPPQLSWDSAHEFMSEDEIAFLKNAPPYEKMSGDYDRLIIEAAWLQMKYKKCSNLASSIRRLAQSHLNTIKKNIGEFSENNLDLPKPSLELFKE